MWRETLEVELPPSLNLLSLGIGFALGCGFCFGMMALGLLPGSRIVLERGPSSGQPQKRETVLPAADDMVPAQPSQAEDEPTDHADGVAAEPRKTEEDQQADDDETPADYSEADPANNADPAPGEPAGAGG